MNKDQKRELLRKYREENLKNNRLLIDEYETNSKFSVDLAIADIWVKPCETKHDKDLWKTFVLLESSFPWKGAVGRRVRFFVYADNKIIGMFHLTSPLAQMRVRDEYLNLDDKWKEIQSFYNIEVCIPTSQYSQLLTGKLLVYCVFSQFVYKYMEEKYGELRGFETTSLYGKSSMYNRIPFLKYLGTTDGMSAIYITDSEWKRILEDYYTKFPTTQTNRLAPVKFQIVDKLNRYYQSRDTPFPFEYHNESFKRGVYLGFKHDHDVSLEESVMEWRTRWLLPRIDRGYL